MLIVRRVGALVLAIAAVAVWFGMAPGDTGWMSRDPVPVSEGIGHEIEDALNDLNASVWENGAYLYNQNEFAATANEIENRTSALIGVGVLVIALAVFTAEPRSRRGRSSVHQPEAPPAAGPPTPSPAPAG